MDFKGDARHADARSCFEEADDGGSLFFSLSLFFPFPPQSLSSRLDWPIVDATRDFEEKRVSWFIGKYARDALLQSS